MELITVASSGNVMMTNAAVSPSGRLFGNFPRWTEVPTPSVGEATADGGFTPCRPRQQPLGHRRRLAACAADQPPLRGVQDRAAGAAMNPRRVWALVALIVAA